MERKVFLHRNVKSKSRAYVRFMLWGAAGLILLVVLTPLLTHQTNKKKPSPPVSEKGILVKEIPKSGVVRSHGDSEAEEMAFGSAGRIHPEAYPGVQYDQRSDEQTSVTPPERAEEAGRTVQTTQMEEEGSSPNASARDSSGQSVAPQLRSDLPTAVSVPSDQRTPSSGSGNGASSLGDLEAGPSEKAAYPGGQERSTDSALGKPAGSTGRKSIVSAAESRSTIPGTVPAGGEMYSVQIGAFKKQENANDISQRLRKIGYNVVITSRESRLGELYLVRLAPVDNQDEAKKLLTRIKKDTNIEPMLIRLGD